MDNPGVFESGTEGIQERIKQIRQRKADIEKKESELNEIQAMLESESAKLKDEKYAVFEELRQLRDVLVDGGGQENPGMYDILKEEIAGYDEYLKGGVDGGVVFSNGLHNKISFLKPKRQIPTPKKRQIKTLLHGILEVTHRTGSISVKDLSAELKADERTVHEWVAIMAKNRMVNVRYTVAGKMIVEKLPIN